MDGLLKTIPERCNTFTSQLLTYVLAVLELRRRSNLGTGLDGLSHGQAGQDDRRGREVHIGRVRMRFSERDLAEKYENE